MKILTIFKTQGMSTDQYDQCLKALEDAGQGNPKGRISHVAGVKDGAVYVTDIWASEEDFAAFGEVLMPIMQSLGVPPTEPDIVPYYNQLGG